MERLKYQLKSARRDKMCILTFLLPVAVGIAIHLLSGVSLQSISENTFGVWKNHMDADIVEWLQTNGTVTQYETLDELQTAINDPATQMIGVLQTGNAIQTLISGDELEMNQVIADTLPQIYEHQSEPLSITKTMIPAASGNDWLKSLLIVMTLAAAMFMGCTFNAMNIISEKEDGIAFINQVLPLTAKSYIIQKTLLGFIGGAVSTAITALICVKIEIEQVLPFVLILLLSAYISALIGLFIGYFSDGLMAGIVYIKIILILFLAPPIFFYLTVPDSSIVFKLSYLLPSSATFYGVMDLLNGQTKVLFPALMALSVHAVLWSIAYKLLRKKSRQK
ncbi:hypothetical protein IMSAGC015_00696 [Lachnospiraceae bacterium]|jgi:hypothetical protein|nr:ABC transporter permease [Dorea sp.]GFI36535.1 hypothetical protein IMSAGC015_00696 [Lachnospiraceae bacterium]